MLIIKFTVYHSNLECIQFAQGHEGKCMVEQVANSSCTTQRMHDLEHWNEALKHHNSNMKQCYAMYFT